jgi:hypothetical protein
MVTVQIRKEILLLQLLLLAIHLSAAHLYWFNTASVPSSAVQKVNTERGD